MAALESDLQRVLSYEADILEPQLLGSEVFDARQPARGAGLAAALGARAGPAQLLTGVGASVAVLPHHVHHLAFAVDIDIDWKRVGVLQLRRA